MDAIILYIFKEEHIIPILLDDPDINFPHRIDGIACNYCGKEYHSDAMNLVDHLQHKHGLKIKEILPSIK